MCNARLYCNNVYNNCFLIYILPTIFLLASSYNYSLEINLVEGLETKELIEKRIENKYTFRMDSVCATML